MTVVRPSGASTALVTGASSGIGREISLQLARRGLRVLLVARREVRLRDLAAQIQAEGGSAISIPTDLSSQTQRVKLAHELQSSYGTPEILVNCAGVSTLGATAHWDYDAEMAMIEVNILAVVDLCVRIIPSMVNRGHGAVLNVASISAFQVASKQAGYAASKAFIRSYSESLAQDLKDSGVSVTVVCPGPVATEFSSVMGAPQEMVERTLPKSLWMSAQEVAETALAALEQDIEMCIPGRASRAVALVSCLNAVERLRALQTPRT